MNKMNTILFDLDETLLERRKSLEEFASWQAKGMLRKSVSSVEDYSNRFIELDSNGAVWKDEVYRKLKVEFGISDWSVEDLLNSYELCFCGFCRLMPHAYEAIKSLNNDGYTLGLVSNGKSPFQERNFNALGISHMFGSVIVSDAVGLRKPEPAIFYLACAELGVEPIETIFVGDNPIADISGANSVGMYTVYIPSHIGNTCSDADAVCKDFRDLRMIVDNAT